jgi:uncharacterized DUF497 family protein
MSVRYAWDERKRRSNLRKHSLDFRDVPQVFEGVAYTYEDDRFDYLERRFVTLGWHAGVAVSIVHTDALGLIRVISFRKASRREEELIFKNL